MSDYLTTEEQESKLGLVIRKPQEGKTSICVTSIVKDKSKNIHIILTMNTLSAGMQFFGRMQQDVGPEKIVVFNSDKTTAGKCHYADSVSSVLKLIHTESIKVIVCCAHTKRIRESLPELLVLAADSVKLRKSNVKFVIHIDEAHAYMTKKNRDNFRAFNESRVVAEMIGYTATPKDIFSDDNSDPLFHKILIRNVERDLGIMRSQTYFGVKDCQFHFFEEQNNAELMRRIDCKIPSHILKLADDHTHILKLADDHNPEWYGEKWYFNLGNEQLMLGFLDFVLPTLKIDPNLFSYHFTPALCRKVTHYQSMEIILKHYPTANVIVSNGNGYELFRTRDGKGSKITSLDLIKKTVMTLPNKVEREKELSALCEPSYIIQRLIRDTPNCPTFITGFILVGMSSTYVDAQIGNFDSVIMSHQHHTNTTLYQLCRFLFNYGKWSAESQAKIKKTQFYSLTSLVVSMCLDYEKFDDRIENFSGQRCSLRELEGSEPEEPTEREIRKRTFDMIQLKKDRESGKRWKKFKVYDGNDSDMWEKAHEFYSSILGKRILGKSMPKKNEDGFYRCSDSKGLDVQTSATFNNLEKEKWSNRFQLKKDYLCYAHVFVGYENLEDSTEYTIFIKFAELVDTGENREFLRKYLGEESEEESDGEN